MSRESLGPRGGKTTMTETGLVRKTIYFHTDEAEILRLKAFEDRRSESEIVREALRKLLNIPD
jgi:hypothetical protein